MNYWINFVNNRFSLVDKKAGSSVTTKLSTLGICFGVMTLIVVMSVMNGFQMSFIDSILEISSYHVRVNDVEQNDFQKIKDFCEQNKKVVSITPFYEAQSLLTSQRGYESAAVIRAINPDVYKTDAGFRKELKIISGRFDLSKEDSIILGASLARSLGVGVGGKVNLFVLSGGTDVDLFSSDRIFTVTGIFNCGYSEINSSYSFINEESAKKWIDSILSEDVFSIEYFCGEDRRFGGQISAQELRNLSYDYLEQDTGYYGITKLFQIADHFKIRGWSRKNDFDGYFVEKDNTIQIDKIFKV